MKRKRILAVCLSFLTVLLFGCTQTKGPDSIQKPTLVITETGGVTAYLVGEFDKEYYELEELRTMAMEEAAQFSRDHPMDGGDPVVLESVEAMEDSQDGVIVVYRFENTWAYTEFTGQPLFYGTVEEGLKEIRQELPVLKNVKDGAAITEEALKNGGGKLIAVEAGSIVYCPFRVTHISEGAVLNTDGSVDAVQAEGTVYILLK